MDYFVSAVTSPCPVSCKPKTICIAFQTAAAGKWKWGLRHCKICTSLKRRLNSLQIPTQISCIILYQDCILASVCMTLHVLNRRKAPCCCQSCLNPVFICFFADAIFYLAFRRAYFCQHIVLWLAWFLERQAQTWMLFLTVVEKRDVSGACSDKKVDSCVNYQLPFICLVHGDTHRYKARWVRTECVPVSPMAMMTGLGLLSKIIRQGLMSYHYLLAGQCLKIKFGTREPFTAFEPSVYFQAGLLHICHYTEILCFKYLLCRMRERAPGFFSPLQKRKKK